jgi:hypothetical protein
VTGRACCATFGALATVSTVSIGSSTVSTVSADPSIAADSRADLRAPFKRLADAILRLGLTLAIQGSFETVNTVNTVETPEVRCSKRATAELPDPNTPLCFLGNTGGNNAAGRANFL